MNKRYIIDSSLIIICLWKAVSVLAHVSRSTLYSSLSGGMFCITLFAGEGMFRGVTTSNTVFESPSEHLFLAIVF